LIHNDPIADVAPQSDTCSEPSQNRVVQEHFDSASKQWFGRYEGPPRRMSDLDLQLRRRHALRLVDVALSRTAQPADVLDVGCGPGGLFDALSREVVRVNGVDLSPGMIAAARARYPRDRYEVADILALPFAGESMDLVTCLGVIEYLPQPADALRALWSVLRPGGRLVVSFPNRGSWLRTLSSIEIALERRAVRLVHRLRGRPPEADGPAYAHRQWTLAEAERALRDAGFDVDQSLFNTFGLYGRLGRLRPALALSAWATRRCAEKRRLASRLAYTMVLLARRSDDARQTLPK
jgi:SAM-dependent methyltransferase